MKYEWIMKINNYVKLIIPEKVIIPEMSTVVCAVFSFNTYFIGLLFSLCFLIQYVSISRKQEFQLLI